MPVLPLVVGPIVNYLQHVLCRILFVATLPGTIGFEIIQKFAGILSDLAEVDGLATLGEKQEAVEFLKENGAGLMNGAKDSLACIGQFTEEGANCPRALTVET